MANETEKKLKKERILCAMSGGVDSSVAAAILKRQGYEVIGIFMKFWTDSGNLIPGMRSDWLRENVCCSAEAASAARAVAAKLNIPFYVLDVQGEFKKAVVDYYIKEHERGRTPNPCVICNRDIKGEVLLKKAGELNADYLATGHYARIGRENDEIRMTNDEQMSKCPNQNVKYNLLTAKDKTKDQTYFLWMLTQKYLSKMLFPIGDYTKTQVRALAKKWQLPTAERRESQGICFIPDRNVAGFLHRHARKLTRPGSIVDISGQKLGIHTGLINYTIGQRERLGLGGPKAYYVVRLNKSQNQLVVGDEKDLYQKELFATDLNWFGSVANSKRLPAGKAGLTANGIGARIRYRHEIAGCQLEAVGRKRVKVTFTNPQRAITPGQSIVFYQGEKVLGGGVIV